MSRKTFRDRRLASAFFGVLFLVAAAEGQQERFVVLPGSVANGWIPHRGTWQPSKEDIDTLESKLLDLSHLKPQSSQDIRHIGHPERYLRQYLGLIEGGKKLIYVNAFCNQVGMERPDWRKHLVVVLDGGDCLWHAVYDPATHRFSGLMINGYA